MTIASFHTLYVNDVSEVNFDKYVVLDSVFQIKLSSILFMNR